MKLRYSYHSEHHAEPTDRWVHFTLFLGAFLLLLAAVQQWFLFFTDWHASDHDHSYYHLILGATYLIIGGALAFVGYRQERASRGVTDRYVRVGEDDLSWSLTQSTDEERIKLSDLAATNRPNIRDLTLTLKDGNTINLPIYLVANEAKQEELIDTLNAIL